MLVPLWSRVFISLGVLLVPPVPITISEITDRSGCSGVHQSFVSTQFADIFAVRGLCPFFILDMLHGIIACPSGAGGSTSLIPVITGVEFITTAVASKVLMGKTCRVSIIVSLAVHAGAAQLIMVALLVIIASWINFLVGQCISSCNNRPGILFIAYRILGHKSLGKGSILGLIAFADQ